MSYKTFTPYAIGFLFIYLCAFAGIILAIFYQLPKGHSVQNFPMAAMVDGSMQVAHKLPDHPTGTKIIEVYFEDGSPIGIWYDSTQNKNAEAWTYDSNIVFAHFTVATLVHESVHLCTKKIVGDLRVLEKNEELAYCTGDLVEQIISKLKEM